MFRQANCIGDSDINGSIFIGDKGMVTTGCYGERTRLVPAEKMQDYRLPAPFLSRSPGHYRDWIRAAKGGEPACSNFSVAGPFVQWMLLGVIAMKFEGKLMWDAEKMRFTNNQRGQRVSQAEVPERLEVRLNASIASPISSARIGSVMSGVRPGRNSLSGLDKQQQSRDTENRRA